MLVNACSNSSLTLSQTLGRKAKQIKNSFIAFDLSMSKMDLEIVRYTPKHQGAVIDLWKECDLVVPQNDPATDIQKKFAFQPDLFLIALADGKVIGSVMTGYEGHRGWINYLAVSPEYQRRSYGRKLVERAIKELKNLGCQKVNLQVRRTNNSVIDFYKHLGFKEDDVASLGMRLQ
jgi:ribosomal protein S18 acetylase RimI-like enzyme